jgi:hypothetical protein
MALTLLGMTAFGAVTPPVLTPDNNDNIIGKVIDIGFPSDSAWSSAITEISVDGTVLNSGEYTKTDNNLSMAADVFDIGKDYSIVVKATGYPDATVIQTLIHPGYSITPVVDTAIYINGIDNDIPTMTVNGGISGLKYFPLSITLNSIFLNLPWILKIIILPIK